MSDLQTYFNLVIAAEDRVQAVLASIDLLVESGDQDSLQQAIALRPDLDAARAAARSAQELYASVRAAAAGPGSEVGHLFVPADSTVDLAIQAVEGETAPVMLRAEFNKLPGVAQAEFCYAGGRVVDNLEV